MLISNLKRNIKQKDYNSLCEYLEGWRAYALHANTFNLRQRIAKFVDSLFPGNISLLQIDRYIKGS